MINFDDNDHLCAIPSVEEIKHVIDQIGALKAPSQEEMSALFYQFYWNIVQSDLIQMVMKFFRHGYLLLQLNHSFLVLTPKIKHPSKIQNYRPLSLCNVAFKVISKILTTRLKGVISNIVSPYQGAFVPDCLIQDNILLGQELLHMLKMNKGRKGLTVLKIDMEKAYDRME